MTTPTPDTEAKAMDELFGAISKAHEAALNAVSHVGRANYRERQEEAEAMVEAAFKHVSTKYTALYTASKEKEGAGDEDAMIVSLVRTAAANNGNFHQKEMQQIIATARELVKAGKPLSASSPTGAGDLREKLKAALPKNFYGWFGPHRREIILNAFLPIIEAHYATTPQAADAGLVSDDLVCWLIEHKDTEKGVFWLREWTPNAVWTQNANAALKFYQRENAEDVLLVALGEEYDQAHTVEHIFCATSAKPVPGDVVERLARAMCDVMEVGGSGYDSYAENNKVGWRENASRVLAASGLLSDQRGSFAEAANEYLDHTSENLPVDGRHTTTLNRGHLRRARAVLTPTKDRE